MISVMFRKFSFCWYTNRSRKLSGTSCEAEIVTGEEQSPGPDEAVTQISSYMTYLSGVMCRSQVLSHHHSIICLVPVSIADGLYINSAVVKHEELRTPWRNLADHVMRLLCFCNLWSSWTKLWLFIISFPCLHFEQRNSDHQMPLETGTVWK